MRKKTARDPSGQKFNRDSLTKKINSRLRAAKVRVLSELKSIPASRISNELAPFSYELTPEQLEEFNAEIRRILALSLVGSVGAEKTPTEWWYKKEIERPVRQGYLGEVVRFNQLLKVAKVRGLRAALEPRAQIIPIDLALQSENYADELSQKYASGFSSIKALSDNTAEQVIRVVGGGIKRGASPSEIANELSGRFGVSESSARRIAVTEVGAAHSDAKMAATEYAGSQTGLTPAVIHVSALIPETRRTHAARHGNLYSIREQREWWDTGSNRINCLCTVDSVLVDEEGNIVAG